MPIPTTPVFSESEMEELIEESGNTQRFIANAQEALTVVQKNLQAVLAKLNEKKITLDQINKFGQMIKVLETLITTLENLDKTAKTLQERVALGFADFSQQLDVTMNNIDVNEPPAYLTEEEQLEWKNVKDAITLLYTSSDSAGVSGRLQHNIDELKTRIKQRILADISNDVGLIALAEYTIHLRGSLQDLRQKASVIALERGVISLQRLSELGESLRTIRSQLEEYRNMCVYSFSGDRENIEGQRRIKNLLDLVQDMVATIKQESTVPIEREEQHKITFAQENHKFR